MTEVEWRPAHKLEFSSVVAARKKGARVNSSKNSSYWLKLRNL